MLPSSKYKLDDELEVQADLMDRISQELTRAAREEAEAKDALARLEARLASDYRSGAEKGVTVGEIAGMVLRDADRVRAFNAHQDAIAAHSEWKGLLEAWRQKGFSISKLAELYGQNYFSPVSGGRRSTEDRPSHAARQAIRDAGGRGERAAFIAQQSVADAGVTPRTAPPTKTVAEMRGRQRRTVE